MIWRSWNIHFAFLNTACDFQAENPQLRHLKPNMSEVGVENMCFQSRLSRAALFCTVRHYAGRSSSILCFKSDLRAGPQKFLCNGFRMFLE